MVYNLKEMFSRRIVSFLLTLLFVSSALYLPSLSTKAEAFPGLGSIFGKIGGALGVQGVGVQAVVDVDSSERSIIDSIAMGTAQVMVDAIVRSTVNWANTVFEGGPAYATDQKQFF